MAGEFILKSGSGGSKQFVDEDQRAYTFTTIESEEQHAVNNGRAWNINTDEDERKRQARRPVIQPRLEPVADQTQPGKEDIAAGAFSAEDLLGLPSELMAISRRAGLEREMASAILDDDEAMILIILAACS